MTESRAVAGRSRGGRLAGAELGDSGKTAGQATRPPGEQQVIKPAIEVRELPGGSYRITVHFGAGSGSTHTRSMTIDLTFPEQGPDGLGRYPEFCRVSINGRQVHQNELM